MRRRRSRRRGRRTGKAAGILTLALLMGFVAGVGGAHTAAFSTAAADRGSSVDVTSDESGAHTLDVAKSVRVNSTESLVNVTNRLGHSTTVTIALADNSTHVGDLVVDGVGEGDRASFSLPAGDTKRVALSVPDDSSLVGETVYFHANASTEGLDVSAPDRNASIEGET